MSGAYEVANPIIYHIIARNLLTIVIFRVERIAKRLISEDFVECKCLIFFTSSIQETLVTFLEASSF